MVVAPISTKPPGKDAAAVPLAPHLIRHLGLDAKSSWIIADEVNQFVWPGPDLAPIPGAKPQRFAYGTLPEDVFVTLKSLILAGVRAGKLATTNRK